MIQLLFTETENTDKKSKFSIHWLDYLLCSLWIFLMLFVGIAMSGASSATSKYIDSMAGLGFIGRAMSSDDIAQSKRSLNQMIFGGGSVKAIAAPGEALEFTQLAQLTFERVIQLAVVAFVKALLSTVLNFLQNMLSKLQDAANQISKLFNISGPVKNLLKILNGRVNVCERVENFVSGLFASRESGSPFEIAYEGYYKDRSISSVLASPGEFMLGGMKFAQAFVGEVSVNAQIDEDRRQFAIERDKEYIQNNLNSINNNADGCELSLSNVTGAIAEDEAITSDRGIDTIIRQAIYGMVDNCVVRQTPCVSTEAENQVLDRVVNLAQNTVVPTTNNNNLSNNPTGNSLVDVFRNSIPDGSPENSINKNVAKAGLEATISSAAELAKKIAIPGADNPDNALVAADPSAISADKSGALNIANPDGVSCGTTDVATGSTQGLSSASGNDSVDNQQANLSSDTVGITTPICAALVQGTTTDAQVGAQAEAATQQAGLSTDGTQGLADAVIGLVNDFLADLFEMLIDTLFSFINSIIGDFCASFAIDAVCDSLTQFSDSFRSTLEKKVETVRINSSKYNSFYEFFSDGDRKVGNVILGGGETDVEIPSLISGREVNPIVRFDNVEFNNLSQCIAINPNTPEGLAEQNRCRGIVLDFATIQCEKIGTANQSAYNSCLSNYGL